MVHSPGFEPETATDGDIPQNPPLSFAVSFSSN
jgi:hypothetical protein